MFDVCGEPAQGRGRSGDITQAGFEIGPVRRARRGHVFQIGEAFRGLLNCLIAALEDRVQFTSARIKLRRSCIGQTVYTEKRTRYGRFEIRYRLAGRIDHVATVVRGFANALDQCRQSF